MFRTTLPLAFKSKSAIGILFAMGLIGVSLAVRSMTQLPIAGMTTKQMSWPSSVEIPPTPGGSELSAENRFQTFIATDKSFYREGEEMYVRAVLLHHTTHQPLAGSVVAQPIFQIVGPKGDVVAQGSTPIQDSIAGFSWPIPEGQLGGQYTIKAIYSTPNYAPAERKFEVRAYRAPRLKTQVKFLRDGYGPGDEVVAMLEVSRAEGGVPTGAKVTAVSLVDGSEVANSTSLVDAAGKSVVRFRLPTQLQRGDGTIAMTIEDGGVVETASKTIPILLQTVDVNVYPEGGDLIAGLNGRVYIEARTPAKKPADIAGVVLNRAGQQVAEFKTEHEGRGRFELQPEQNETYSIQILEPRGIHQKIALPEVQSAGASLRAMKNCFAAAAPVELQVATTHDHAYVTLSKREKVLQRIELGKASQQSGLLVFDQLPPSIDGVLIATVWRDTETPIAERLVFRESNYAVRIEIQPNRTQLTPGGKASVKIVTTDEKGKPLSAQVGVTVTDESVLEMVDKREQSARLPVQVLLESEVRELADASIYFNREAPSASLAIDLLLGTQGWRRFATLKPDEFVDRQGQIGLYVLARSPLNPQKMVDQFGPGMGPGMGPGIDPAHSLLSDISEPFQRKAIPAKKEAARAPVQQMGRPRTSRAMASADMALAESASNAAGGIGWTDASWNKFEPIRVYAHRVAENREPNQRTDFAETLFWSAGLRTDERGEATFDFDLSDSITSYQISAEGFSAQGALGASSKSIQSVTPFYIESKLPLEVTAGDTIDLPIAAINATENRLNDVRLHVTVSHAKVQCESSPISIGEHGRIRQLAKIEVGPATGIQNLEASAQATLQSIQGKKNVAAMSDSMKRTFVVRPLGFPVERGRSGRLEPGQTVEHELSIGEDLVPGSMVSQVIVYPSPLANLTRALEQLIQEPHGCFEQTSSTTYPLVMAQQYFLSHPGVDPAIIERAARTLDSGYKKLIGFECKSGGFEWFGHDPGHDALTAYGLMEFADMSKVRLVDSDMMQRAQRWLLAQRDGEGLFARKTQTMHSWMASAELATTYNVWALLESRVDVDLSREIDWVRTASSKSTNSYVLALAANVLALAKDHTGQQELLSKLAELQTESGSIRGATMSVIGSSGEALEIETVALATLAWLRQPEYSLQVERSMKYLLEHCQAGRFGSTQSTILALKAIVAYDTVHPSTKATGSVQLMIDGRVVGESTAFSADEHAAIKLPPFSLTAGKHTIALRMEGGSTMPYSITANYNRFKPDSSPNCGVYLETRMNKAEFVEGDAANLAVTVVNQRNEPVPTPVAIIGIPGGLEVRHDQLKELVKAEKIAAYEVRGRELILYWRSLDTEARIDLPVSLIAAIPGRYTAPASRAYLYYTDEFKHWVDGVSVTIRAK